MATKAQIETISDKMQKAFPVELFHDITGTQSGMMAILRLLSISDGEVSAGEISQALKISTARVAALLKKMTAKGLITREKDLQDSRVTLVRLTDLGETTVSKLKERLYERIGAVIDAVGEETLLEFIAISTEIKTVLEREPPPDLGLEGL